MSVGDATGRNRGTLGPRSTCQVWEQAQCASNGLGRVLSEGRQSTRTAQRANSASGTWALGSHDPPSQE
jgi:hypothetical protein